MNYERAWKDLKSWVCSLEQDTKDAPAESNHYELIVGQNWAFGAMYDKMDELDGTRKDKQDEKAGWKLWHMLQDDGFKNAYCESEANQVRIHFPLYGAPFLTAFAGSNYQKPEGNLGRNGLVEVRTYHPVDEDGEVDEKTWARSDQPAATTIECMKPAEAIELIKKLDKKLKKASEPKKIGYVAERTE